MIEIGIRRKKAEVDMQYEFPGPDKGKLKKRNERGGESSLVFMNSGPRFPVLTESQVSGFFSKIFICHCN